MKSRVNQPGFFCAESSRSFAFAAAVVKDPLLTPGQRNPRLFYS